MQFVEAPCLVFHAWHFFVQFQLVTSCQKITEKETYLFLFFSALWNPLDQCGESLLYFHQLVLPLLRKPPPPTPCSCSSCYTMACSIPITLHHASSISLPPVESLKQQACLSASERRGCPSALTAIHHQPHHLTHPQNKKKKKELNFSWPKNQVLVTSFKPSPSDGEQWCFGFELFPNCLHLQPGELQVDYIKVC